MLQPGSRYANIAAFDAPAGRSDPFRGLRPRSIGPAIGVIEHVVQAGDRLDLLARHYYNDDRRWWRIVDANPEFLDGKDMTLQGMEGRVIVIPRAEE